MWIVRCALAVFALGAVSWGVVSFPIFLDQTRLNATRDVILRNVAISEQALAGLSPLLDRAAARDGCVPAIDRSSAVIRLRLAEVAFTPVLHDQLDDRMKALDEALRKSLSCSPTDAYLWLALFWTKNAREGFSPGNFDLLRMSYRMGPNEAWIAEKRSQLALAMFGALPPDLADDVLAEFARLVKSELYTQAMAILSGPGWPYRDRLMAGLSSVPPRNVAILIKAMADIGYNVGATADDKRRS